MISQHDELKSSLKTILPAFYEMALTSKAPIPCISYMELGNNVHVNGDTLGYSRLNYQIKVWANRVEDLQTYALEIDEVLRPLGWTRVSSNEMYDAQSTMMQKILNYEAMALEEFK